ncbi:MAG TPA: 50S ribosomal protein L20 [bacterium]|nr:50S ribosomal protein L20 [bacterium]
MVRAKKSTGRIARKGRTMKAVKGFSGGRSKLHRTATEALLKQGAHATGARRKRKGDFRRLWITRINAAARRAGIAYSTLIAGLKQANITLDRKLLAELAVSDQAAFNRIVATVQQAGARAAR